MGRRLRYLTPGGLVEITISTLQGRFLLLPEKEINEIILGVLGRAQRKYPVAIHGFVWLSNHGHFLVSPKSAKQLSRFCAYLLSNVARKVGKRIGWREKIFGRRYSAIPVTDEEAAQVTRLRYLLEQGCKEGLVDSPREWPGASSVLALLDGSMSLTGTWWDETKAYRLRQRGKAFSRDDIAEPEQVQLTPLPCWRHLSADCYRRRIAEMVENIEVVTARRHFEQGTRALGVKKILSQRREGKPRRSKRSPAPFCHARSRESFWALWRAYQGFVVEFRIAADRLARGVRDVAFPEGAFPPPAPFVDTG